MEAKGFEIGPIRPPSEAKSLLLRVTRNCPWNKCNFCTLYKRDRFGTRPIEDIKADIDRDALYRDKIMVCPMGELNGLLGKMPEESSEAFFHVLQWIGYGEESVFLQDANTMVLSHDKLLEILVYLKEKLPKIKRVTSYGRVDSLTRFTTGQLAGLRKAGLDRIHSGFESGSDKVLALINKGYTKAQEIEAGQKVKAAGIELSVYYMPGCGGAGLSDENALETAEVINKVNPDFVRIRTFVAKEDTKMFVDIKEGQIAECNDKGKALELKKMIESIDGADGYLYSDHIVNLLETVNGNMKTDKAKMLSVFDGFLALAPADQRRYQIARRLGMIISPSHLSFLPGGHREVIDSYLSQYGSEEAFESLLSKLLRRYI